MIHAGELSAGEMLPSSRELMKMFGVGRPAIREALFSLQKMGLVTITNGACARVTRPTASAVVHLISGVARYLLAQPDGIRNLQDARAFFEMGLARQAACKATSADIDELAKALKANHDSLNDLAAFEVTDVAFHCVLAVITRNPIFAAIHEAMMEWLREQRHVALRDPNANKTAYRSHKKIFDAVAARDPDAAEEAMRSHLLDVSRRYWSVRKSGDIPAHSDRHGFSASPKEVADRKKRWVRVRDHGHRRMAVINYLTQIEFDHGAVCTLPATLDDLGIKRPLVITDKGVEAAISIPTTAILECAVTDMACSLSLAPWLASIAGGAGARPDHPISSHRLSAD
jgi:GntR family transcriptional repressor for pyruvate dehydrogenase complex